MKIICWLLFVAINGYVLFVLTKKFQRPFLLKLFPILIAADCVLSILIALAFKLLGVHANFEFLNYFTAVFFSIVIICFINFFNQLFFFMVDSMVSFHQEKNSANLDRQPIRFLIANQQGLKQAATIIWFLGSALMLYGVWLGPK